MSAIGKNNEPEIAGKSVLDDSEAIYQTKRIRATWADAKGIKGKSLFIWNYYKWALVLLAVAILAFVTLFIPALTHTEAKLTLTVMNQNDVENTGEALNKDFCEYAGYDDLDELSIQSFFLDLKNPDSSTQMAILARLSAKELDVFLTTKEMASYYSKTQGCMEDLESFLPEDMKTALKDRMITLENDEKKTGVFALDLTDSPLLTKSGYSFTDPVLCVVVNSKNKDAALSFIRYAFDLAK